MKINNIIKIITNFNLKFDIMKGIISISINT